MRMTIMILIMIIAIIKNNDNSHHENDNSHYDNDNSYN